MASKMIISDIIFQLVEGRCYFVEAEEEKNGFPKFDTIISRSIICIT
jgi:hypothetical protein